MKNMLDSIFFAQLFVPQASQISLYRRAKSDIWLAIPSTQSVCGMEISMEIYVVKPGDTIDRIAEESGARAEQIIFDNQLIYPYELAVGQARFIGDNTRNLSKGMSVSGYA